MTSSLVIAKFLGGVAVVGGIGAAATTFAITTPTSILKPPGDQPKSPTKAVIVKSASANTSPTPSNLTVNSTATNYQCRLTSSSGAKSACKLVKLDTAAKWIDITKINSAAGAETIASADLSATGNYFKLIVESELFEAVAFTSTVPTIDIVSVAATPISYATLTPLFKLDDTAADYKHATHLLGKAQAAASSVRASGQDSQSKCSFETAPTGNETPCTAIAFGDSAVTADGVKYSQQTFNHTTTALDSLVENKYYLLKYTTPESKLLKNTIQNTTTAYVAKSDDSSWGSKGTLAEVALVIIDGTDSNAVAFILSTHTVSSDS